MNCKPGDLAIVIGNTKYAGRIVEVLCLAPSGCQFKLPNGQVHAPITDQSISLVLRFIGSPVEAKVFNGTGVKLRTTYYGCGADAKLRPISGLPDTEDTKEPIKERA